MRSFRTALLTHRWPVLLALAIFLGGTNYCVAVAIAGPGAGLACGMNAMATASSESSAQALPPCHAHPAKAPSKSSPNRGPMPCCITLAPASSPPDAKPAVEVGLVLPPGLELAVMPLAPWREAPIELDTGPPELLQAGSHSSRAPPLV